MAMNDPELLHAYVGTRSESAFAELVQRHLTVVFFAALRQVGGDAHRAKDVSQIVFTELARKASTLVNRPTLTGWLYCTTRFAALHLMRAERRRERREQEACVMNNLSPDSDVVVEWERLKPVVDDALHALKEQDREAILLRFFHGRPFAEIGDNFGITADAARFRVDRALARMRALLAERGITSTAAALGLALASQAAASPPAGLAASGGPAARTAAGLSTSIGLLKIMTTAKSAMSTVIALLCIAGVGEAWLAWSQAQELSTLGPPRAAAETTARSGSAPFAAASAAAGATRDNSPPAAKAPSTPAPGAASAMRPAGTDPLVAGEARPVAANFSQAFTVAMNDPQFRRLLAVSEKARLNLFYAPLFTKLNLSVDQLDHFKDLLVDKQQAVGDANRAALSQGDEPRCRLQCDRWRSGGDKRRNSVPARRKRLRPISGLRGHPLAAPGG
jgi:RNA polymerase sigma factor (sigma-70 family)